MILFENTQEDIGESVGADECEELKQAKEIIAEAQAVFAN
jgi:hypothetical protein